MTVLELIAIRDFLKSIYRGQKDVPQSVAECDSKFEHLKGKYTISNADLCELLSKQTNSEWSYKICEMNDFELDNLFNAQSKSLMLTFSSGNKSLCAMGTAKTDENREILEQANWFDIMLTMQTDKHHQKRVYLPNGYSTIIRGKKDVKYNDNKDILYNTLIETIGSINIEPLLQQKSTNAQSTKTTDGGKK